MDEEKTKGRTWNGYACPGCRTVFRVAADFAGTDVMCPACGETLRLPKTPEDVPPRPVSHEEHAAPEPAPHPSLAIDPPQAADPSPRPVPAAPSRRIKLLLVPLVPLAVFATWLALSPRPHEAPEKTVSQPPPVKVSEPPAPAEPAVAPVPETTAVEPVPPTALPQTVETAPVVVETEPEIPASPPRNPAHLSGEEGLVEAIPANSPAPAPPEPPPVEVSEPPAEVAPAPEPIPAPAPIPEPAALLHTVARGDTLHSLARRYQVDAGAIKQANGIKDDVILQGQELKIPGGVPGIAEPATPATSGPLSHNVVRGDTLDRIARKYGVEPRAIMKANGMKNDVVRLGRKLVIPPARP